MIKKNKNRIVFVTALLAMIILMFSYASHSYKKIVDDATASNICGEEKVNLLPSDIPFLESLTRHFLILHH